ncbi:M48 family metalloprotease [Solwaraspora sp. WMMA2101]|uniref:M48 family metalloprotease n=1 Tax=Solwaraspora sp. WMMA2101 TaxID=3404124 RepID=UPI003B92E237
MSTSQFVLLAGGLVASGLFGAHWLLVLRQPRWFEARLDCLTEAAALTDSATAVRHLLDCTGRLDLWQAVTPLAGPLLLFAAAWTGYRLTPWLIGVRFGAGPVRYGPDLERTFTELVDAAGLVGRDRPRLRIANWRFPDDALTYGRPGRYRVLFGARLVPATADGVPAELRTVLAHEISHLVNRDVTRTYLLVGGWLAAVPLVALLAVDTSRWDGLTAALAGRLLIVVAVLGYAVVQVIRSREHDADLRAMRLTPPVLPAAQRWQPLHPTGRRRAELLADPAPTLRWSAADTLVGGIGAGLILTELPMTMEVLLPTAMPLTYALTGTVVAVPLMGVVWLGAVRTALADRGQRRVTRLLASPVTIGLALGVGLLFGSATAARTAAVWSRVVSTAPPRGNALAWWSASGTTVAVLLAVAMVAICVLGVCWLAGLAAAATDRAGPPRWLLGLVVTSPVWGLALGTWFLAARLAGAGQSVLELAAQLRAAQLPVMLAGASTAAVALLAAALLSAAGRGRRRWRPNRRALGAVLTCAAVLVGQLVLVSGQLALVPGQAGAVATPEIRPRAENWFLACRWISREPSALGPAADAAYQRQLGAYLTGRDDPMLRHAGAVLSAASISGDEQAVADARRAVLRRCEIY